MDAGIRPFGSSSRAGMPRRSAGSIGDLLLALSLLVAACGGGDEAVGPKPVGEVDQAGGTVTAQSGRVELVFPPGAVPENVKITVEPAVSPPARNGLLSGSAYDFGPDGTRFAVPVQLKISYDPAELPAGAPEVLLSIQKAVGTGWQRVEASVVDPVTNSVTAPISSFSIYAVVFLGGPQEVFKAGDTQNTVVGQPVAIAPSVQVRAADGVPLPGLQVTFQVVEGGGSLTGASRTTDAQGRAAVGSWTVGTAPGANRLRATVEGLSTPVEFTATAVAGAPATLTKVQGDAQSAGRGMAVELAPMVRVADLYNNALEGVDVTFTADAGGVVAPGTVTTDAQGLAAVERWTLGTLGANVLTASVTGVGPVSFTAESLDPCENYGSIAVGEVVEGTIDAALDCLPDGSSVYRDRFHLTGPANVGFSWAGSAADVFVTVYRPGESAVRVTSFVGAESTVGLLGVGDWIVQVHGSNGATGAYRVELAAVANDFAGCPYMFLTPGATIRGIINGQSAAESPWYSPASCQDTFAPQGTIRWFDTFWLRTMAGSTYTVGVTPQGSFSLIFSRWTGGQFMELKEGGAGQALSMTFAAPSTAYWQAYPLNNVSSATGGYTITLSESGGGALRADANSEWSVVNPQRLQPKEGAR